MADIRIATFAAPLSRDGPGLLLRDLGRDDPQIDATIEIINHIAPDILVLSNFDFDMAWVALNAFNARLDRPFDHLFSARPNAGLETDLDMDGNGRKGEPRDAQGYGVFTGDGGLAILSRYPIGPMRDFTALLWQDLPSARLPRVNGTVFPSTEAISIQRLSSTNHWIVPVETPIGPINLLAFAATPPVFDGAEDRNGLRNADEIRLWELVLSGHYGPPPENPIVIGNANLDPLAGDGLRSAIRSLLENPALTDPTPAQPTAIWPDIGQLRVSYVLPSSSLTIQQADTLWSADVLPPDTVSVSGPHRIVWVDVAE
ncbi:endonuclease [Marivivens niveibacter]|uniref:Endonuclease n=1 Tax=Marivivens niveibacter TaxID=1930667 RepID=A0A251X100_9RHOB|nr:endonuclease/exonuclease/phosphatase family protein [Marivivens niveibacter]OUD09843.1 endonuclease [Marivivens niveibacter]